MLSGLDLYLPLYWPKSLSIIWALSLLSIFSGRVNFTGTIAGGLLATAIFLGGGWNAFSLLVTFFVVGTLATQFKFSWKVSMELAQAGGGKRGVIHAVSNVGVAATCCFLGWLTPEIAFLAKGMAAASLAAALSDTMSSELGNVYGSRFYNILGFKKDTRGADGVVSPEGTLFGLLGSTVIAVQYGALIDPTINVLWVFIGGFGGNILDSVLGASFQRKGLLNNHEVNIFNTLFGAVTYAVLYLGYYYFSSG